MKFLAFNLAVGLALIFLFTADKGDVHKAVDRAHNIAADIKKMASEKIGNRVLKKTETPAPAPEPAPDVASEQVAKPVPIAPVLPAKQTVSAPPAAAPTPAKPSPKKAGGAPSNLDPAVAKRRAEVLGDNPPIDPAPVLKRATSLCLLLIGAVNCCPSRKRWSYFTRNR